MTAGWQSKRLDSIIGRRAQMKDVSHPHPRCHQSLRPSRPQTLPPDLLQAIEMLLRSLLLHKQHLPLSSKNQSATTHSNKSAENSQHS